MKLKFLKTLHILPFIFQTAKATFPTFVPHFILLKQIRRVAMEAQKDLLPSFHLFLAPEAEEEGEGEGIKNHIAPQTDRTGERRRKEKKKSVPNCPSWQGETQGGKREGRSIMVTFDLRCGRKEEEKGKKKGRWSTRPNTIFIGRKKRI